MAQKPKEPERKAFDPRPLELTVLAFMIAYPEKIYMVAHLGDHHFLVPSRRKVFRAIKDVHDEKGVSAVEISMILAKLAEAGVPEVEAFNIITDANDFTPQSPEGIAAIAEELVSVGLRRSIGEAGHEIEALVAKTNNAEELAAAAADLINNAVRRHVHIEVKSMADEMQSEIERMSNDGETAMGYRTGFSGLDRMICGLHGGELVIIAGRPSMGKSSLLNHMVIHLGYEQQLQGCVISLEMSAQEYSQRIICNRSHCNLQQVRLKTLNPVQRDRYIREAAYLGQMRTVDIHDGGGASVTKVQTLARRLSHEKGLKWLAIDQLTMMDVQQKNNESTTNAIGRCTHALKALARSLEIPVILLSQLNRDCEKRDNKRPVLSDLRASGDVEQDADVVIFLHREEYYHQNNQEWRNNHPEKVGVAELIVAKQRNGPTGTHVATWIADSASFREYVQHDECQEPIFS